MIRRFQIEDLVAQDSSGVVFEALDTETGRTVAVRRFIPFGADGGGLPDEERIAYEIAVARLAGIQCPGLRSVITGGCDPVDGMPFIATEWIEGQTLRQHALRQPLTVPDVIHVLTRALEVCGLLSEVLAEEGVWVEMEMDSIVIGQEGGGRGVTFWISPWKWLGRGHEESGFSSVITLTEDLMGWKDQNVGDLAGNGLGGWLKWLRGASHNAGLAEVRELLAAATGTEPPAPTKHLLRPLTRPVGAGQAPRMPKKKGVNGMMVTLGLLSLITAGLVTWAVFGVETRPPEIRERLSQIVAELEVYPPEDPRLVGKDGSEVRVEGVFEKIDRSSSGETLYLLFSKTPARDATRGSILLKSAGKDLSEEALTPMIGRKIRLRGEVRVQRGFSLQRPDIILTRRTDIEVVE